LLNKLFEAINTVTGADFTGYRRTTIVRRIQRRMALRRTENVRQYVARSLKEPAELQALFQDMLIHVTEFFREPDVFEALKAKIIPALLRERNGGEPVRVWVPGCASGEEVYSLAMLILECAGQTFAPQPALQIFGTDLSELAVVRARKGL